MRTIARFAVRHRWYVIGGWVVFVLVAQLLAAAAGGATYKDVFTLPHTETQTVLDLLRAQGQSGQTGQVGTVVVSARTGTLSETAPPPRLLPTLRGLCSAGLHVASVSSPWAAFRCADGAPAPLPTPPGAANALRPAHNPLLSTDDKVGIVTVGWQANQNAVGNFAGVRDRVVALADAAVSYHFTGGAFDTLNAIEQKGIPPEAFGFLAALLILALVFRSLCRWSAPRPRSAPGSACSR
jgi:RND superfamily putative drug exporter